MIPLLVWGRKYFHTPGVLWRSKKPIKLKGRSPSSQQWLSRQVNDPYVKQAQIENYRARSAFKLLEIDARFRLLRPGHVVVDCGAAPGSWSQVAVEKVNALGTDPNKPKGKVVSVDLQYFEAVEGAILLTESDFTHPATQSKILSILNGQLINAVLSDMAPNATGVRVMDHENIVRLCRSTLNFAQDVLREDGHFLGKLWDGHEMARLKEEIARVFRSVKVVRPDASRKESSEIFLLGKGFKRYLIHNVGGIPKTG
ncbi:rRNA methyltransferase 2, mitochondrial-like isoform X2 [Acanthaster planci]|nr:rRNA methyltransferase 2, mitochondrial-like isoform X2 [Acanthaster planci]